MKAISMSILILSICSHQAYAFDINSPIVTPIADNENRYSPGRTISPVIGSLQTFDNEASLQAAKTSVNFDIAETELFKTDKQTAINFFDQQRALYEQSGDKQADTAKVNDAGTARLRESATTFRNFHSARAVIMNEHLEQFPTENKLLQNCLLGADRIAKDTRIYDLAMEEMRKHYDEFTSPPKYEGDRCLDVMTKSKSFNIKNDHVPQELELIVGDSSAVVSGMTEVLNVLDDPNRNLSEKYKIISDNPAWGLLNERRISLEACEKVNCLNSISAALELTTSYSGSENYGNAGMKQGNRELINAINRGGKFDTNYHGAFLANSSMDKFQNYAAMRLNNAPTLNNPSQKTASLSPANIQGKQVKETQVKQAPIGNLKLDQAQYTNNNVQRNNSSDQGSRGADGVLRTKSGKVVQGFEAPASEDIFKIISSRYQKKFFTGLGSQNE